MKKVFTKEEWLGRLITCNENGKRAISLNDVPLIVMTRKNSFNHQGLDDETIDKLYKESIKKYIRKQHESKKIHSNS